MEAVIAILLLGLLLSALQRKTGHGHRRGVRRPPRGPLRAAQGPRYATPAQRRAVLARDGYKCRRCGSRYRLEIDHVIPHSWGGPTVLSNLQALCHRCNMRKGARYSG